MALCESTEKHHPAMMQPMAYSSPPPPYEATMQSTIQHQQDILVPDHQRRGIQSEEYHTTHQQHYIQPANQHDQQWNSLVSYGPPQYAMQNYISNTRPSPSNGQEYFSDTQLAVQQQISPRPKPCVIPQVTKVFGGSHMSPFVRSRAPELEEQYGLSPNELLTFIDALNESFLANPALQAVGAVGSIVGFVPLASTQIASSAMSLAAGLGTAGVSFVRTKRFMKKANETIFKPKGLHVQLCKTDQMLNHIGMANNGAVFAGQQSQAILENVQTEAGQNPISRRMEVLGDRVTKLTFDDVNAPIAPDNWMKKVAAYSAQRAESEQLEKLNKKQVKSERKPGKHERKASKAEYKQNRADEKVEDLMEEMEQVRMRIQSLDPTSRRYEKAHKELRKEWKELEKDLRETERDQCRGDRKSRKVDEKSQKRLHKDGRKVNKILWIVIMPDLECASSDDDDWDSDESMGKDHDS